MPKHKFITKKKILYSTPLLHRSQQDPLIADENAPQRVVRPVEAKETAEERKQRIEEQQKYGIYFDDDENYMQYLKDVKDRTLEWPSNADEEIAAEIAKRKVKLNLPEEVFPSEKEDDVGMLNKAMPVAGLQLNVDPDIVAAMDEDFDFDDPENQLEDNFMQLADGAQIDSHVDEHKESEYFSCSDNEENSEEMDELKPFPNFEKEEVKSRFTNYSLTSSVLKRNAQLRLLDAKFERVYAEYDDSKLGAPDSDGEAEYNNSESINARLLAMAEEYEKSLQKVYLPEKDDECVAKTKELISNGFCSDSEEETLPFEVEEKEKSDCKSFVSSNTYHQPALIPYSKDKKIKINQKTGLPKDVLGQDKLTLNAVNRLNEETQGYINNGPKSVAAKSVISQLSALSFRPKDETSEERRERKKALKIYRRERVKEKKLNKEAFKEEDKRQRKIAINNRQNIQGNIIL